MDCFHRIAKKFISYRIEMYELEIQEITDENIQLRKQNINLQEDVRWWKGMLNGYKN